MQLIAPLIKSELAFYHIQVNLFIDLVERLLEEGKLCLYKPDEFHKEYPEKAKTTISQLAALEGLKRHLRS